MSPYRLLVIEDNRAIAEMISRIAAEVGFETFYSDGVGAMKAYDLHVPQAVVLDIFMPGKDGIEILQCLKNHEIQPYIIIISGSGEGYRNLAEQLGAAHKLKIVANIPKPCRVQEVRDAFSVILSAIKDDGNSYGKTA